MAASRVTKRNQRTRSPPSRASKRSKTDSKMGSQVSSETASTPPTSTSTETTAASSKPFLDAIRGRRSLYALNKESPISDHKIRSIVEEAILHTPSTFNTQSTRIVLLLHAHHDKFWKEHVKSALKPLTPEENFPKTSAKMDNFAAAYGTILFYEDQDDVKEAEQKFSLYADRFQSWSEHTSAMHQLVLWTALEAEGFGANIQHYNPVVDERAAKEWDVPSNWTLKAQIVFGGKVEGKGPAEKTFKPIEQRLKVFV